MEITFNKAQKALGHLRNPQQGSKPPLLDVKGWEKSKKLYHLKDDIERAFKAEIDRFRDLIKERNELQQAYQNDVSESYRKELEAQVQEINDEINELFEQEKELELTDGKLTQEEFGDVIDTEIFIDLDFAIEMNGTPPKNQD